jgi:glyoxylate/hydroxypyruvate reductase
MKVNKGALAILVHGGTENWSPQRWKSRFDGVCPDRPVVLVPDTSFDPAEVHYAAVWKPRPGELAAFPNWRTAPCPTCRWCVSPSPTSPCG